MQSDYFLYRKNTCFPGEKLKRILSVSFWVNKHQSSNNWKNISAVNKWNNGSQPGTNEWQVGLGAGGNTNQPNFSIESGSTIYSVTSPDNISLNTWHHIVGIRKGGYMQLYVDGQKKDENFIGNISVNNVGRDLFVGRIGTENYTNGSFDYIHIYSRGISEEEVNSLYMYQSDIEEEIQTTEMVRNSDFGKYYRFGFQGHFSGEDMESSWNGFEHRLYDPVIGRWNKVDPYREHWSSYLGMGNNPLNVVDPDGGTIIFINGFRGAGLFASGYGYWDYMADEFLNFFDEDINNAMFADGDAGITVIGRHSLGRLWAKNNIESIKEGYEKTGQLIIVSHSMGTAFGNGVIEYLEEQGLSVENHIAMAPFQDGFVDVGRTRTSQMVNYHDRISGNSTALRGDFVDKMVFPAGGHSLFDFNWVFSYLRDFTYPKGTIEVGEVQLGEIFE